MNPLEELHRFGQAPWMDYIDRGFLATGGLRRRVEEDGVTGVTSNPTIFDEAVSGGSDYDRQLEALLAEDPRRPVGDLYERLAIEDIRAAADVLRPVYDRTGGADGLVSLEVSPYLAYDTAGTLEEARRLWRWVERPNLMLKVPATREGIPAIEQLTAEGINVNVTLMFSLDHYEAVAGAYVRGLERLEDEARLGRVASVASFFVSRVDGKVDPRLEKIGGADALALRARIAIANSKRAYARFREIFHGERFAALAERGARVQRVLWGSTSTKNPEYRDVLYVEELIGADTVNTLPPKTLEAFRDHGRVRASLEEGLDEAEAELAALAGLGIDLDQVAGDLQREGVEKFAASFDHLLATIESRRRRFLAESAEGAQRLFLGRGLGRVAARLTSWQDSQLGRRLWAHDRSLWVDGPESEILDRLGWLTLPWAMAGELEEMRRFAEEVRGDGIERVVLLGMGGSSLAPEVFAETFGRRPGWPRLTVLDSTHPRAVAALAAEVEKEPTLFVVSSKSGTTVETLSLFSAFWERLAGGDGSPGGRFAAITDPGTPLAELAAERGFRRLFVAPPDLGGRYSALSHFGLVPAALAGVDVAALLDRALAMAEAAISRPELTNEPLVLGAALGELAAAGRDKLTLLTTAGLATLPDWLEQLIAESTGKEGRGIVPVAHEPLRAPEEYGDDRCFAAFFLKGDERGELDRLLGDLERRGRPLGRFELADRHDLGREMFRWEVAVAAAGAALGIHPFNQPDVELAKQLAREAISNGGAAADGGREIAAGDREELARALDDWLAGAGDDGYVAVQAYLPPSAETAAALSGLQRALARRTRRAVTAGYGPRFLHSTGQLHKGGPEGGLFLQLTDQPGDDLPVPGSGYTFGTLIRGQALGDRRALARRDRRVLAVALGKEPGSGLAALVEALG